MELSLPSYYVVSRQLPSNQAQYILDALQITPITCAIVSDVMDAQLALLLCDEVLRASSDENALAMAEGITQEINQPVLVIGEAALLDAVYEDGRREAVATVC